MIAQSLISYGQIYDLFGYKQKELDLDGIFDVLLYSISVVNPEDFGKYPIPQDYNGAIPSYEISLYLTPELSKAKDELHKYLGKPISYRKVLGIEARLRSIQLKRQEWDQISWWQFAKLYETYCDLCKLEDEKIDIKDVYTYLEYCTQRLGMANDDLYQKFKSFAETYPKEQILL